MSLQTIAFAMVWAVLGGITLGVATQAEYGMLAVAGAMYVLTLVDACIEAITKTRERRS